MSDAVVGVRVVVFDRRRPSHHLQRHEEPVHGGALSADALARCSLTTRLQLLRPDRATATHTLSQRAAVARYDAHWRTWHWLSRLSVADAVAVVTEDEGVVSRAPPPPGDWDVAALGERRYGVSLPRGARRLVTLGHPYETDVPTLFWSCARLGLLTLTVEPGVSTPVRMWGAGPVTALTNWKVVFPDATITCATRAVQSCLLLVVTCVVVAAVEVLAQAR